MSDSCVRHIEGFWKLKTNTSNELFNKGYYAKALEGYKDALYRAEVLNNNTSDCLRLGIPFVQVYIISCNNLAYTYSELGDKEQAEKMLKRVLFYLLHLSSKKEVESEQIQSELKKAMLTYVDFTQQSSAENPTKIQLIQQIKNELREQKMA